LRDARRLCSDGGRYIDYGVRLYTVAADPDGDEVLPGRPHVVALREPEEFGGIWDARLMCWHDETANPVVWYCSAEQRRLILHGPELPDRILCRGAEGAGKTRGVVAPWALLRAIEFAGQHVELGGTAPTMRRLETLRLALTEKASPDWYTWRQRDGLWRMPLGVDLRLLSTHRSSEAEGSPVQGFDWAAAFGDELQDQLHAVDDILARGRRAPGGRYRMMDSASVKDTAAYRSFEERWKANRLSTVVSLSGFTNPFVAKEHWENLRNSLDDRSYRRRVLAENVGKERATYPDFAVETHQIPVPRTARDVTPTVAGVYESYSRPGAIFRLVACHDPGEVQNTTVLLRAFLFPGRLLVWMAVAEFITKRTTQEQHAAQFRVYLQETHGLEESPSRLDEDQGMEKVLVFRDPHGRGEKSPDEDVERAFRRHHFDIFTAAPGKQVIKRRSRIEMMNRIIKSASGKIRFYCACNERGESLVPETLRSFQDQERDELEQAEKVRKGEGDITHAAVAVGYGLHPFEREEVFAWTFDRVLKAEGVR
jgi:hypothetical protein